MLLLPNFHVIKEHKKESTQPFQVENSHTFVVPEIPSQYLILFEGKQGKETGG